MAVGYGNIPRMVVISCVVDRQGCIGIEYVW